MRISAKICASSVLASAPVGLAAQDVDMEVMMKWSTASVVAYHIVGSYQGETNVALNDISGQLADVTDQVIVDVSWNLQSNSMVGDARVQNFPSALTNPRNVVASCAAPVLEGNFELVEVTGVVVSDMERIDLSGTRSYPAADITDCSGATERRTVASGQEPVVLYLPIPSPVMLGMPNMPQSGGQNVTVSPDRKSFVIRQGGWTWTYTPTLVS